MTKNIKEIGKELLGKSLNSFHRKTGLTQLEENNKMQDGILDGILSQVDNAYIEKTEQSNVIHLDGSGDGVVTLDSIEGNTMVNLCNKTTHTIIGENSNSWNKHIYLKRPLVVGNKYTLIANVKSYTLDAGYSIMGRVSTNQNIEVQYGLMHEVKKAGIHTNMFTAQKALDMLSIADQSDSTSGESVIEDFILLEGDYRNKEINFFEGMQSSFEEQVEHDKYKIEILSNNKNLLNLPYTNEKRLSSNKALKAEFSKDVVIGKTYTFSFDANLSGANGSKLTYCLSYGENYDNPNRIFVAVGGNGLIRPKITFTATSNKIYFIGGVIDVCDYWNFQLEENTTSTDYILNKQNKIKLLINEPLRQIEEIKDKLCVIDGKLTIERKCGQYIVNGTENWLSSGSHIYFSLGQIVGNFAQKQYICITEKYPSFKESSSNTRGYAWWGGGVLNANGNLVINPSEQTPTPETYKEWVKTNNYKVLYVLAEPVYEEVLNEYGEPILFEGYENGTIYIDSTIVPTTTIRYTPKMESFKTLKEVENNNIMLTNDVNDNIIPYMMDVDLMIMEKEMALMSHKNIRKMEVLDMTSMQKRTQDMLERLIKGRTLTEQECKTRVTTYLNAGKITDAQAEELMLLIDEVYA